MYCRVLFLWFSIFDEGTVCQSHAHIHVGSCGILILECQKKRFLLYICLMVDGELHGSASWINSIVVHLIWFLCHISISWWSFSHISEKITILCIYISYYVSCAKRAIFLLYFLVLLILSAQLPIQHGHATIMQTTESNGCLPNAEQQIPPLLPLPGPLLASCPSTNTSGIGNTGSGSSVSCQSYSLFLLDMHMWGLYALYVWRTLCNLHNCNMQRPSFNHTIRKSISTYRHNIKTPNRYKINIPKLINLLRAHKSHSNIDKEWNVMLWLIKQQ